MIECTNDDQAIEELARDLAAWQKRAAQLAAAGNRAPNASLLAEVERDLADATVRVQALQEHAIALNPGTVDGWLTKAAVLVECLREKCAQAPTVHAAARVLEADARRLVG